ncbi:MAG: glycosyltransferase family 4 protein [Candidatus Omnitrophica bacterium]|nr:glycosyltransferase family 4 protein [Candidatus Omnitrophota bacterium]
MKIAVFHILPSGGAKRALCQFVKELSKRHEIDEFTTEPLIDYLPLKNFVKNSYVYPLKQPVWPKFRPYILDCFLYWIKQLVLIQSLEKTTNHIADDINHSGYDIAYVDLSRYTHAPIILKKIKIPKLYFCHDPRRDILEGANLESDQPKSDNPVKKFYLSWCQFFRSLVRIHKNRIDKQNVNSVDYIVTNSCYTREYIHKVYHKFAHVNYLGVDTKIFKKIPSQKKNFVLSVGRIYKVKGHHYTVQALTKIPEDIRPTFKIVSDCSNEKEISFISDLTKQNNVNLEILQMVGDAKLIQLYNEALMVVYVPVMEPFGFVPLESMACGTPVIGIREAGVRESVVHEYTGLLVDRDVDELAQAIMRMAQDTSLREKLSRQGMEYVYEKWIWERAAENLEKHMYKCIKQYQEGTQE